MTARAMWKGVVQLGDDAVPVKLYAGVQDRSVHFRLLHADDLVPVKQRMVHPATGDPVAPADSRRGYQVEDGRYVLLSDDDLASIEPPASRDIEITRFVPPSCIDPGWYDRPYFLGPDGDGDGYRALAAALGERDAVGVARWTMRKLRYLGALRARDGYLMLHTLRFAEDVAAVPAIEVDERAEPTAAERDMAVRLTDALAGDLDLDSLRDEHRERVLDMIHAKAKGEVISLDERRPVAASGSLTEALEQSLRALRTGAA